MRKNKISLIRRIDEELLEDGFLNHMKVVINNYGKKVFKEILEDWNEDNPEEKMKRPYSLLKKAVVDCKVRSYLFKEVEEVYESIMSSSEHEEINLGVGR